MAPSWRSGCGDVDASWAWRPPRPSTCESAEIAFVVSDAVHGLGIATLLLEHLAAAARAAGIQRFTADVLADNAPMLQVMRDAGFMVSRRNDQGVVTIEMDTSETAESVGAADDRDDDGRWPVWSDDAATPGQPGLAPDHLGYAYAARIRRHPQSRTLCAGTVEHIVEHMEHGTRLSGDTGASGSADRGAAQSARRSSRRRYDAVSAAGGRDPEPPQHERGDAGHDADSSDGQLRCFARPQQCHVSLRANLSCAPAPSPGCDRARSRR